MSEPNLPPSVHKRQTCKGFHESDSEPSNDVTECPVCKEWYRDPRLLRCGHHFCLHCLIKVGEGHPQGTVPCPTCRHVTEDKVGDLPAYVAEEFTVKVGSFLGGGPHQAPRPCHYCGEAAPATLTCFGCYIHFCTGCRVQHRPLEEESGHPTFPLTPLQFCPAHPDTVVSLVCARCHVGCCDACAQQHDAVEDVCHAADVARFRLHAYILQKVTLEEDSQVMTSMAAAHDDAEGNRKRWKDLVTTLRALVKEVDEKVNVLDEVYAGELGAEVKDLRLQTSDVRDFIRTKKELLNCVLHLATNASDPEVALRTAQLPQYASDRCLNSVRKRSVKRPDFRYVERAVSNLQSADGMLAAPAQFSTAPLLPVPLRRLALQSRTRLLRGALLGMTYNDAAGALVCRTTDNTAPVQVYNNQLDVVTSLGAGIEGITDGYAKGIAVDRKRHLYVLPTSHGNLVTMDMEGKLKDSVEVTDKPLFGVCCRDDGRYVTSRCKGRDHSKLYVINPCEYVTNRDASSCSSDVRARQPPVTGGVHYIEDKNLLRPYHVTTGRVTSDHTSREVLYVSDWLGHEISMLSTSGRHLQSYVRDTAGTRLRYPGDVCSGPGGRLLLCDSANRRVVAFWHDGDVMLRSEVMVRRQHFGSDPYYIACDTVGRALYVGLQAGEVLKFGET